MGLDLFTSYVSSVIRFTMAILIIRFNVDIGISLRFKPLRRLCHRVSRIIYRKSLFFWRLRLVVFRLFSCCLDVILLKEI